MKNRIVVGTMAVVFALCIVGLGFAAKLKCTVDAVDGEKATLTCENADKLAPGDKVKIAPPRQGQKDSDDGC